MRLRTLTIVALLAVCCVGCPNHPDVASSQLENRTPMTLDESAARLAELAGTPLRRYSTFDFGRGKNEESRSVVVTNDEWSTIVTQMRDELPDGIICFLGTTRWLGDETHEGVEVVVANGDTQFDILRVAKSDAVNYGLYAEDLIKRLQTYHDLCGIEIFHAETDTIEFVLVAMPDDLPAFCEDLYDLCPDVVDQGAGTLERLEQEIKERQQVFLWWD